ncbi:ATP-binding protein [Geobacter sp. AOG1]|uniref:sensor histidine kinase n=1 Tax=Geobacter sp. AOG1 TaxID=1566346 RepID=UPI001CC76CEA|nr:ATP-binding protein [Geobacter sp. AOG1]GFE57053.1 histidine kinase [Geobacter sp. AOG1]
MTPASSETTLKPLTWVLGLVLISLLLEAFLSFAHFSLPVISRLLDLIAFLGLVMALVLLHLANRKKADRAAASHSRELLEMQREVDKTALRYKSLLEGAGNAIFVFNVDSGILEEVNRRGTEMFGYGQEELASLHGKDLVAEDMQDKFTSLVLRVRRRGRVRVGGITFRRRNGEQFLGEIEARLIDLGDEKVVHAIVRDVTQKYRSEREIRQRNRELSHLNSIVARANQSLDLPKVLTVTLKENLEVFGAEAGVIHLLGEDGASLRLGVQHNLSGEFAVQAGRDDLHCGGPCRVMATQHCHALSDLHEIPCRMGQLAVADGWRAMVGLPLFAKSRLIGIMHVMSHTRRTYSPEELTFGTTIGNQIGIVIEHAMLFAELNQKTGELLRSHRLLEKNSRQLTLSQHRLKKNLSLIEQANLELERLNRMKTHFLGLISHEFRTPLTGILGSAEYLMESRGDTLRDEERQLLEMIHQGGTRLNEIVTDLLKVARLESNAATVIGTTLHLTEILDLVLSQFQPLLDERGQIIVTRGVESLPHFSGDREFLIDIFMELLENAIKFTPDGGEIVVAGQVVDRAGLAGKVDTLSRFNPLFFEQMGTTCYLQVVVQDSGIGIDDDEQLQIFEKFYGIGDIRHHSSGRHKFQGKGPGLGLAIVKGMVEAQGGMVWVESPFMDAGGEAGSAFIFLLPMEEGISQPTLPFMRAESATDFHSTRGRGPHLPGDSPTG